MSYALNVCCVLCIVPSVRPCVTYAFACVLCGVCSVRNACFINSGFFLLGIVCGLHVLYPWGAFCMCDRDFCVACV